MSTPAPDISLFVTDLCAEEGGAGGAGDLTGSGTVGRLALWAGGKILGNASGWETAGKLFYGEARLDALECGTLARTGGVAFQLPLADGSADEVLKTDGAGHLGWLSIQAIEEVTMAGDVVGPSSASSVRGLWDWPLCSKYMPNPLELGTWSALVFQVHTHEGEDLVMDWGPVPISTFEPAGDLTGYLGAPTVARILNRDLSATPPLDAQVLTWNATGSCWEARTPGTGGAVTLSGDVTGLSTNTLVSSIQGGAVDLSGAMTGYVMTYSRVLPSGFKWLALAPTAPMSGDVTGSTDASTVVKLRGRDLNAAAPGGGDVLAWDDGTSSWTPTLQADLVNQLQGEVYGASDMTAVGGFMGLTLEWAPLMTTAPLKLLGVYNPGGGDRWRPFDCLTDFLVTGEVQGSLAGLTVKKLFDEDLDRAVAPVVGYVLAYTSVAGIPAWRPTLPAAVTFPDLGGDVEGSYATTTVKKLWNRSVTGSAPTAGDLLWWSGASWGYKTANWIELQSSWPGSAQTGNIHVTGRIGSPTLTVEASDPTDQVIEFTKGGVLKWKVWRNHLYDADLRIADGTRDRLIIGGNADFLVQTSAASAQGVTIRNLDGTAPAATALSLSNDAATQSLDLRMPSTGAASGDATILTAGLSPGLQLGGASGAAIYIGGTSTRVGIGGAPDGSAQLKVTGNLLVTGTVTAAYGSFTTSVTTPLLTGGYTQVVAGDAFLVGTAGGQNVFIDGAYATGAQISIGYRTAKAAGATSPLTVWGNSTTDDIFRVTGKGSSTGIHSVKMKLASVILSGAALATNATDGFVYIPTCAGTPTGVPTAQTGTVAMVYDTANSKLYVYTGAWVAV